MKHYLVLLQGACIGSASEIHANAHACLGRYAVERYGYMFPQPDPSSLTMDCLRLLAQEVYGEDWADNLYLLAQIKLQDGFWIVGEEEDLLGDGEEYLNQHIDVEPEYEFLEELEGVEE